MEYENVRKTAIGRQFRITLDRKDKPNPIDGRTLRELNDAITSFEASDQRVLSITGSGTAFATGADISQVEEWFSNDDYGDMLRFVREGQNLMNRIDELRAPSIAAIDGYALGGGMELALACDFRFAADSATLGLPEINLGMIPGWGGTQRLPALVGESTAKDLLLTGRQLDAREAHELGLVDRIAESDELLNTVDEYAETLGEKPVETVGYMLDSIHAARENPLEGGLTYELMCDILSSLTDETRERTAEFIEQ